MASGVFDLTLNPATDSAQGAMSAVDKTKLDAQSGVNTGDQQVVLSGSVIGTGGSGNVTSVVTTLSNTGVISGSYTSPTLTVGSDGIITSITNGPAIQPGEINTGINIGSGTGI